MLALNPLLVILAIMECHSMTQSSSTFATKCFRQIVYVLFNLAELVAIDPCML